MTFLEATFRSLYVVAMAMVFGGTSALSFVTAPLLFKQLTIQQAGDAFGAMLRRFDRIGQYAAFFASAGALGVAGVGAPAGTAWLLAGVAFVLGVVFTYLRTWLTPKLDALAPPREGDDPRSEDDRGRFERLHQRYVQLYGFNLLAAAAALVIACLPVGVGPEPSEPRAVAGRTARALPAPGELNAYVVDVLESYPTDGTHAYWWPKTGSWAGNVRTLRYDGEVLLEGDPEGRAFCCGLTFEVFLQAWQAWAAATDRPATLPGFDRAAVLALKDAWFGTDGDRTTLHGALTRSGLGVSIDALEDAREGDFVQFWRHSGSGHSVIFRRWVRDADGTITGLAYWSVQGSTSGISEHTESFGDPGIDPTQLYIARPGSDRGSVSDTISSSEFR